MRSISKIAICGLGYVGLPLGIRFAFSGVQVLGVDVDENKVNLLNDGRSYIKHINSDQIQELRDKNLFEATTDFHRVSECDAILICVPTPLGHHNEPDISFVIETGKRIAPYLNNQIENCPKLVVLESTTYPGTTDEDLRKVLEEESGLEAGDGFFLAYSPEREDPGRIDHSVKTIPKVMGGYTSQCLNRCKELYSIALDTIHPVSSTKVAEATKLMENIFRAVNIALVNELKVVYNEMNINIWEVIEAASTKPFGYMPFYPGPGLGGHCIPIDPFYLTWKAKEYEKHTRFIELAGEINTSMPYYIVGQVFKILNDHNITIKDSHILLCGLAYKKDVDDDRESPSYKIWDILAGLGANISYNDPYIPVVKKTREYPQFEGVKTSDIDENYDCIIITTDHSVYKSVNFDKYNTIIIDTRNISKSKNTFKA